MAGQSTRLSLEGNMKKKVFLKKLLLSPRSNSSCKKSEVRLRWSFPSPQLPQVNIPAALTSVAFLGPDSSDIP